MMDSSTERFPAQYAKNGEKAIFMYQRSHPSSGVNTVMSKLSQGQFGPYFHGTDTSFSPGDEITSPQSRGARRVTASSPAASEQDTSDVGHATYAAHTSHGARHYGNNVYEVEPTGHVHPDPESPELGIKSYSPFRVVRQVDSE